MALKITVKSNLNELVDLFKKAKTRGNKTKKVFINDFFKQFSSNKVSSSKKESISLKSSSIFNTSLARLVKDSAEDESFNIRAVGSKRNPFLSSRDLSKLKGSGLELLNREVGFTADDLKDTEGFLNPSGSVDIRKAKKDTLKFLSKLNVNGLRKLISNDKPLLNSIISKLNREVFIIQADNNKIEIVLLRNIKLSVNALLPRIIVNSTTGKITLRIDLDKNIFDKSSDINKISNTVSKTLDKTLSKESVDNIISLLFVLNKKPQVINIAGGDPPTFLMNVTQDLPQDRRVLKTRQDRFISSAQYTAILQQQIAKRMPRGPRRGPPLSDSILTFRSGRFVNSIKAIINFKQEIIKYFFNPIYKAHRETVYDPDDNLIKPTIRATTKALFGKHFRIIAPV